MRIAFVFLAFMAKFNNCFLHTSTFYIFLILLFYHHRYPHIILWKKLYIKVVVCKHLYSIVGKLYIMQKNKIALLTFLLSYFHCEMLRKCDF